MNGVGGYATSSSVSHDEHTAAGNRAGLFLRLKALLLLLRLLRDALLRGWRLVGYVSARVLLSLVMQPQPGSGHFLQYGALTRIVHPPSQPKALGSPLPVRIGHTRDSHAPATAQRNACVLVPWKRILAKAERVLRVQ